MFSINEKGKQISSAHKVPIVEYGFGEQQRILTAKIISEHNNQTSDIDGLIYRNLDRTNLDEIAGKLLSHNEVNTILKLTDQNLYIKDYTKILVPPRGKKGKDFKEKEINRFLGRVNSNVEKYLVFNLGVPDLEHIPSIAYKCACFLIKECYTLPPNLKVEFSELLKKLLDKRSEVIEDNQLKNISIVQGFREELQKVKQVIKGYLTNVHNIDMQ